MKTIKLGGGRLAVGRVAIVDDEDFERVSQHRWIITPGRGTNYAYRKWRIGNGRRKTQSLHHFVIGITPGTIGKYEVDHKNRNGLDCRKENLRLTTGTLNQANTVPRGGTSKFKGVAWHKASRRWRAYIQHSRRWKHLGYFAKEIEAAAAYDAAAQKLFGEFARLNIVQPDMAEH